MKKFLILFLISFSVFSQNEEKLLSDLTNKLCSCIEKTKGEKDEVLKKCTQKVLSENPSLIESAKKISDGNGGINSSHWSKINTLLTNNCDKYNSLIIESFVDKNQKFIPLIEDIGNQVCEKISSFESINDKKIQSVMIPLLKKNQNELIKALGTPQKVMRSLNNYLTLNCTPVRNYYSKRSLNVKK